jgi:hypothetical protein
MEIAAELGRYDRLDNIVGVLWSSGEGCQCASSIEVKCAHVPAVPGVEKRFL